jgi:hypothetical protein
MNEFVIKTYFRVTRCETNTTGWRQELHQTFVREYPSLSVTEQNIADRRSAIIRRQLISPTNIECIKVEVQMELAASGGDFDTNDDQPDDIQVIAAQVTNDTPPIDQPTTDVPTEDAHHQPFEGLTQQLEEQFYIALVEFDGHDICDHPSLPKQNNSRHLIRLTNAMNDHILPSQLESTLSFEHIHHLIYCSAVAIIRYDQIQVPSSKGSHGKNNAAT